MEDLKALHGIVDIQIIDLKIAVKFYPHVNPKGFREFKCEVQEAETVSIFLDVREFILTEVSDGGTDLSVDIMMYDFEGEITEEEHLVDFCNLVYKTIIVERCLTPEILGYNEFGICLDAAKSINLN